MINLDRISQPYFQELIRHRIRAYQDQFGERLVSIYVRGSVQRGEAVEGISDLNLRVYTADAPTDEDHLWTNKSRQDLDDIFDYILQENPQIAADVLGRIEQATTNLADHPGLGRPGRVTTTRELIIPGLPWILPYLTGVDTLTILRVIHAARQWPYSFGDESGEKSGES